MKKIQITLKKFKNIRKAALFALPFVGSAAFAEGTTGTIDLTAVTNASSSIQTALTSFFTNTLAPLVVAIGGVALAVYLILVLFRWARKLGK